MYCVSKWRKEQRKVKERSARFLVGRKECTMQKGKEHALDFFYISKGYKASSNLGKPCGEKVEKRRFPYHQSNGGLQHSFLKR